MWHASSLCLQGKASASMMAFDLVLICLPHSLSMPAMPALACHPESMLGHTGLDPVAHALLIPYLLVLFILHHPAQNLQGY